MHLKLLWAGVAAPVLYFATLIVAASTWPGYDHARQYASELGGPAAPHPMIFNLGAMGVGVSGVIAGIAFFVALRELTGHRALPALVGVLVAAWGVGVFLAGYFPIPDERHGGFGLPLAIQIAPLAMLVAIRHVERMRWLRIMLAAVFVVMAILFAIMMGVGGLVRRANVGIWQRSFSLVVMPWLGFAAIALQRRLAGSGAGAERLAESG